MVAIMIFCCVDLGIGGKTKGKELLILASKLEMLIPRTIRKQPRAKEKGV